MSEVAAQKNPAPKRTASLKIEDGETIPVLELRFNRPGGVDIPGKTGANGVRSGAGIEREGDYELAYVPRMRHHRIAYRKRGGGGERVVFVHETWCSFEPAE